jgi:hypothetical protein
MMMKKQSSLFLLPLLIFLLGVPVFGDDTSNPLVQVISPKSGTWANLQPLVLETKSNAEVYYSLNGSDPLKSGFAYDGPVLINTDGDVTVRISAVLKNISESFSINYTVTKKEPLPFIFQKNFNAFVTINSKTAIDIPNTYEYEIGQSGIKNPGCLLKFDKPVAISRLVPLVIYSGVDEYRYVLQTGDEKALCYLSGSQFDVTFNQWNYITFKNGGPVVYSVDGGTLMQSKSGHIKIDRSKDHTISWYYNNPYDITNKNTKINKEDNKSFEKKLFVPAKTTLIGVPESFVSTKAVSLQAKNSDYLLGFKDDNGQQVYCQQLTVDVLAGDAIGFDKNISFYYDGAEQGSVSVAFIIDKIPPLAPEIISSASKFYSRENVKIDFDSDATVYYAIADPIISKTGFYLDKNNIDQFPLLHVTDNAFKKYDGNPLILESPDTSARLFTVYAYSKDFAGNKGKTSTYRVIVDTSNYYIDKKVQLVSEEIEEDGSPAFPYTNLDSLAKLATSTKKNIVHVKGHFVSVPALNVTGNLSIEGDGDTRFDFAAGCGISVTGGDLSVNACTMKYVEYTSNDIFRKYMINVQNASLFLSDCELVSRPGATGSAINVQNSKIRVENTGITVQAIAYVSTISAENSELVLKELRSVGVAQTAVGISVNKGMCSLDSCTFSFLADLPRALECTNSSIYLKDSRYESKKSMNNVPAIWMDKTSKLLGNENNIVAGFSKLFAE